MNGLERRVLDFWMPNHIMNGHIKSVDRDE